MPTRRVVVRDDDSIQVMHDPDVPPPATMAEVQAQQEAKLWGTPRIRSNIRTGRRTTIDQAQMRPSG